MGRILDRIDLFIETRNPTWIRIRFVWGKIVHGNQRAKVSPTDFYRSGCFRRQRGHHYRYATSERMKDDTSFFCANDCRPLNSPPVPIDQREKDHTLFLPDVTQASRQR